MSELASGQQRVLALVFTAAMLTYFDRVCLSTAAPAMQMELGLTQVQMGYVFSIFNIAYALAEVPSGWLGDRWGQKLMMVRIVGGWSLFTMLTGAARAYGSLLAIRFAFGAMEAGAFPTLSRALSHWFPPERRSRANGVMWTGSRLGGALAPAVAAATIAWAGWRWTFAQFGAVGILWCLAWMRWYRDNPQSKAQAVTLDPVPWRSLLTNGTLLALFWAYFASGFGFQFFVTWLPTFLMKEHGLSLGRSGFYASLPLLAGAAGSLVGGLLADRLGRRVVGVCGFLFSAIAFVGSTYAESGESAIFGLVLAAGLHDVTLPVAWATCVDVGGRFGGTTSGYMNLASSISGTAAPIAAAWLAEVSGTFAAVFWVAAAVYAIGALLWLFIDPKQGPICD
ncbi:MAG: MFS transporter [Acidobacteria bacterium]|nr:MFS transporter [Acidobacteriota bacterium]